MLFSSKRGRRPGAKGPAKELIDAVVEMKRRNPTWGCPRIAQQITLAFGVDIELGSTQLTDFTIRWCFVYLQPGCCTSRHRIKIPKAAEFRPIL